MSQGDWAEQELRSNSGQSLEATTNLDPTRTTYCTRPSLKAHFEIAFFLGLFSFPKSYT